MKTIEAMPDITPPEHVGITWLIIISPILLLLSLAALEYIYKNPPEFILAALEWLRMRKDLRVELSNRDVIIARQKARIAELENERYGTPEDIDYDEVIAEEKRNRHNVHKDFQEWQARQGETGQKWHEKQRQSSEYEIDYEVTK